MASGESLALILGLPEAMQLVDRLGQQGVRGVLLAMKELCTTEDLEQVAQLPAILTQLLKLRETPGDEALRW